MTDYELFHNYSAVADMLRRRIELKLGDDVTRMSSKDVDGLIRD
jgi:hypothetical protein